MIRGRTQHINGTGHPGDPGGGPNDPPNPPDDGGGGGGPDDPGGGGGAGGGGTGTCSLWHTVTLQNAPDPNFNRAFQCFWDGSGYNVQVMNGASVAGTIELSASSDNGLPTRWFVTVTQAVSLDTLVSFESVATRLCPPTEAYPQIFARDGTWAPTTCQVG